MEVFQEKGEGGKSLSKDAFSADPMGALEDEFPPETVPLRFCSSGFSRFFSRSHKKEKEEPGSSLTLAVKRLLMIGPQPTTLQRLDFFLC